MIAWIDGTAGASGDMLLGALVGAGTPLEQLTTQLDRLGIDLTLTQRTVQRGGLAATKVDVVHTDGTPVGAERHRRGLRDVVDLLEVLDEPVRSRSTAVFERLARAEATVHGIGIDEVHFHEVGALDAIADVVGVVAGAEWLRATAGPGGLHITCSTLNLGSGTTRSAHGPIPVPAPAVLELLTEVAPVAAGPAPFEATTPTGASLLAELVDEWAPMPAMTIERVGLGAGGRDTDVVVNAVRLVVGHPVG